MSEDPEQPPLEEVGKCFYCGDPVFDPKSYTTDKSGYYNQDRSQMAIEEHVTPKSRGGADLPSNKVLACHSCNCSKRDKTLEEYRIYLAKQQDEYVAAEKLMEVAQEFDLPESGAIQRAAGRLLDRASQIEFYGEKNE